MADLNIGGGTEVISAGGGAVALSIVWGIWDRWFRSKSKKEDTAQSERDHMLSYLDTKGKSILERMDSELERSAVEITRLRTELDEERTKSDLKDDEVDRWKDVARGWKARTHEVKHTLDGTQSTINIYRSRDSKPEWEWPNEKLPPLEDILADNERRAKDKKQRGAQGLNNYPEPEDS